MSNLLGKHILIIIPKSQFCEQELDGVKTALQQSEAKVVVLSKSGQEARGINKKKFQPIKINHEDKIAVQFLIDYKKRLKKINEETKKYSSKTILVTQIVHKDHFVSNALNLINIATKNFCIENQVTCLPLDEKIDFDFEKDFYDGIHTRPSGNKKIAEFISYEIKKKIQNK